ncbi:MAG: hypothetical protein F6K41_28245 [Symploca sp. SIO3E6]|nr:hypothetical protein [Caldora sp. SIO3E6]
MTNFYQQVLLLVPNAEGRRQEAGGRRQEAGGRREERYCRGVAFGRRFKNIDPSIPIQMLRPIAYSETI